MNKDFKYIFYDLKWGLQYSSGDLELDFSKYFWPSVRKYFRENWESFLPRNYKIGSFKTPNVLLFISLFIFYGC
ncbi:hypothetical protein E2320_020724 [Naja naja]|nr:hypothetical protein E2320_020724 [Naja naja]